MTTALWSGRLAGGLDPDVKAFTASLAVDRRLLPYDLRASAAHVRMLAAQGILDAGLAMRFPRFTGRWRDDKTPQDSTTTTELVQLYRQARHRE